MDLSTNFIMWVSANWLIPLLIPGWSLLLPRVVFHHAHSAGWLRGPSADLWSPFSLWVAPSCTLPHELRSSWSSQTPSHVSTNQGVLLPPPGSPWGAVAQKLTQAINGIHCKISLIVFYLSEIMVLLCLTVQCLSTIVFSSSFSVVLGGKGNLVSVISSWPEGEIVRDSLVIGNPYSLLPKPSLLDIRKLKTCRVLSTVHSLGFKGYNVRNLVLGLRAWVLLR